MDSLDRTELVAREENVNQDPYVGMEFDSEDAAKKFYEEYARHVGFIMRIDQCRRSEVDKRILSRRLSCNKQGYYIKSRDRFGPVRKPRSSTREGCNAMMLVKVNKSGKWVVTRFEKEHTHPLFTAGHSRATDAKDRRIQELHRELERQDQLCTRYREHIVMFLRNVEEQTEQLSVKIQEVVNNVRDVETEVQNAPYHQ